MRDRNYRWFIAKFKKKAGGESAFVFRGFTVAERRRAGGQPTPTEADLLILSCCVLEFNPEQVEKQVAEFLLKEIYKVSGWTEEAFPFKAALEWFKDEDGLIEGISVAMVAGLDFAKLDHADPYDRARYLLIGKWMFESLYGYKIEQLGESNSPVGGQKTVEDLIRDSKRGAQQIVAQELKSGSTREEGGYAHTRGAGAARILPDVLPEEMLKPPVV